MSQMSGVAGDGFGVQHPKAASSGRAILLLALAVVLSVVLLHALDDTPNAITATKAVDFYRTAPPGATKGLQSISPKKDQ